MRTVLYITYDGLTDPLGQSQILAYLKRLGKDNKIIILSYEKIETFEKEGTVIQKIVDENSLTWVRLSYTKKPPIFSTLKDIRKGIQKAKQLHKQFQFHIVHCRGYIPAMIGLKLKSRYGIKFVFDMRGWWADERKESGFWKKKVYRPVYFYFKKLEKRFFGDADFVVSLTYKGREVIIKQNLAEEKKVGVIPTCVDFEIFKPWDGAFRKEMRRSLGILEDEKVFIYSGSLGGNYDPQTLIEVFKSFRELYPQAFLLVLSKDTFDEHLKLKFSEQGIDRINIYNVPFSQVTNYLRASDVGFIYYRMSFSTIGRSPTKLGEYWASGIPVITFKGIGDLDYILSKYPGSGVLLSEDKSKWASEMKQISFLNTDQLRQYSENYFHINKGVNFYRSVYESLSLGGNKSQVCSTSTQESKS